ncbi:MAG: polymerase sigma-54 factor [Hyphomicrobiales bacterium]|nr:polymerase sigma-54 factor [Hyphomicrobiales bacterium]
MALSTKLMLRQGQSLVMTPQLLQAIKLLQLSSFELSAFVEQELERNPLLERSEEAPEPMAAGEPVMTDHRPSDHADLEAREGAFDGAGDASSFDGSSSDGSSWEDGSGEPQAGDWAQESLATDAGSLAAELGTEVGNTFDADRGGSAPEQRYDDPGLSATSWTGAPGSGGGEGGEAPNLEAYVAEQVSLSDHLARQLAIALTDPTDRLIGHTMIDAIDETGYLRESVEDIAERLGASVERVMRVLSVVHTFEPSGVGARDLAECIAIQLRERDRFDPAMEALVANLPLLARRDFAQLRKICGVDDEDIADMLKEIRRLDPKPGRAFGGAPVQPVAPDVTVRAAQDGSWHVELNPEGLPRVLVNQTYAAKVARPGLGAEEKTYIAECLQNANWLTRSLEQRARTILKVATEIVRQQDAFFARGVEHLRPLNLKMVADAIGMHESTVSRVTSNKYLSTPRGLFEFKYFFTASIPAQAGGDAHSAESVRYKIKQLIDQEKPEDVLSDDAIVVRLKEANVVIARRTVAKYRESLRIPSSVERRREKTAMHARQG